MHEEKEPLSGREKGEGDDDPAAGTRRKKKRLKNLGKGEDAGTVPEEASKKCCTKRGISCEKEGKEYRK